MSKREASARLLGASTVLTLALSACATRAPARPPAGPASSAAAAAPAAPASPLPEVTFRAGEPPRGAVGLTGTIAAPAVMGARLDALAALADAKATLRAELYEGLRAALAEMQLPPETLDALDERRPIGAVFLAEGLGVKSALCVGAAFRDAAGAQAALARLGVELARSGAESTRRLSWGSLVYAGVHGRTLLVSSASGTNPSAGPLVEELQARPASGIVDVSFFPRVVVPFDAAGLTALAADSTSDLKEDPDTSPEMAKAVRTILVGLAPRLADVSAARFVLDLDAQRGLTLRFAVEPVPGSPLARILANPTPYRLDPRIGLSSDGAIVMAWGTVPNVLAAYEEIAGATGPAGHKVRADLVRLGEVGDGSGGCSVDLASAGAKCVCAWRLRPGARPAEVLKRYERYVRDEQVWLRGLGVPQLATPKARTKGGVLEIDQGPMHADSSEMEAAAKKILGGDPRHLAAKVIDDSLFVAWGVTPEAARAGLGSTATASAVAPAIAAAASRARSSDVLAYADLGTFFARVMSVAADPQARQAVGMLQAIPGLAELRLPVELTATSGLSGVYELRVPGTAFQSLARLARPYLGTMGTQR